MPIRVVLLDDHPLFREGLRAVLEGERDITIVGEAADSSHATRLVRERTPDVVVADVTLPGVDGIEFARALARRATEPRVLVLTVHARADMASKAFDAGAVGFALKTDSPASIVRAVRAVAKGDRYLTAAIPANALRPGAKDGDPLTHLTERERQVFDLVVRGYSNASVSRELSITLKTVQTHRAKINRKLDVHSTADLVRFAARRGLISE